MDNTGAAECFACPERYYCDGTDPQGYVECTLGHYCETGTDVPTNCPAGEHGNAIRDNTGCSRPSMHTISHRFAD